MKKISIEMISDYVCPWCYVGKRRLERAMSLRPEIDFVVNWLPFQLSPDMPREGRDRVEYYRQIFGASRAEQIMESMRDTGADEGIAFDTKPGARSPNTLSAHVLMLWAAAKDNVDSSELAEKLFYAHHVECEDIGDHEVLARMAGELGMDSDEVATKLASGADEDAVDHLIKQSVGRGIGGVPFFVINDRYGVSGAQPAEELVAAFDRITDDAGSAEAATH